MQMRMDQFTPYLQRTTLVANRKGGVLKSSIVRSVADEARRSDYRVLVLDGDPQGNLSKIDFGLGQVEVGGWDSDRGRSLAMALQYGTDLAPIAAHGVDVVCGGPELLGALGAANNVDLDLAGNLRGALARLCSQNRYDLVLIDSAPGETKLLDAYMLTAKWLVVPVVEGDEKSMDGLDLVGARTVDLVRNRGADIELLGAVLTLVDHRAPARNKVALEDLAAALGAAGEPFVAMIRDLKAARSDTSRYGLSAGQLAEKAVEVKRGRLAALRRRAAQAKSEKAGGKHKAEAVPLDNPDEPWLTRDGSGLAEDYQKLTTEILGRIGKKLGAEVA
ncbi:ParA family protein [Nocardioides sp.]|uniref:ParA family protein n=1 Tax=Nocardioides sp. TaxID=35761 RepID=UPI00321AF95C